MTTEAATKRPWEDENKPIMLGSVRPDVWFFDLPTERAMTIMAWDALEALQWERARGNRLERELAKASSSPLCVSLMHH